MPQTPLSSCVSIHNRRIREPTLFRSTSPPIRTDVRCRRPQKACSRSTHGPVDKPMLLHWPTTANALVKDKVKRREKQGNTSILDPVRAADAVRTTRTEHNMQKTKSSNDTCASSESRGTRPAYGYPWQQGRSTLQETPGKH